MKRFCILSLFLLICITTIYSQQVTFKVKSPGSLSSMIAESKKYTITNMKIVGAINSDDMLFICEMASNYSMRNSYFDVNLDTYTPLGERNKGHLEVLDLSEASFVEGGNGYIFCKKWVRSNTYTDINLQLQPGIVSAAQFARCNVLKKLILPDNLTEIRDAAFYWCTALEEVVMPAYATKLGYLILYDTSVREINLGKFAKANVKLNVTFDGAKDLMKINIDINNPYYKENNGVVYSAEGDTLLLCPAGYEGACSVAEGAKIIASNSFGGCSKITSIVFPESVVKLEKNIFYQWEYYLLKIKCQPKTIFCYGETPPSCDDDAFYYIEQNTAQTTLYVPRDCKTVYEYAKGWGDFLVIEEFSVSPCPKPSIAYTNGKLEFHCNVEGADYVCDITDADVKTHHGSIIPLTGTYNISVYATAPGYDRSDSATATLCWIKFEPSMEGEIENVDYVEEVKARPVLIQAEGNTITVQGAAEGTEITAYNTDGMKIGSVIAGKNISKLPTNLLHGSISIVKIGDKSLKVRIQ